MIQRILSLVYKELLTVVFDKKSRIILIIPPILQLLVFSFAATLDVDNITLGILNRDNGEQSIELIQRFEGSPVFKHIVFLDSIFDIQNFLDYQKGMAVLSIDEQFSRNLDAGKPSDIQLILDGRKSNSAQIIAGYANSIFERFNYDFAYKAGLSLQKTDLVSRNWFNPNLIYYWFNVPNLSGLLTMLVALIITAMSVAREKELGTFEQLLVSPITPIEIMIGKTIPAIVIGMIEGTLIILAGIYLFKIPFEGSFPLLWLNMFVFISSIVGVGLFVSSLSATQQQALLGIYVFMAPSVLLSGFATPIENMPHWMQNITYLNPLRYYLVVAKGVFLKDMPFNIVFQNTWPMMVIAFFNLLFATLFFRRRVS